MPGAYATNQVRRQPHGLSPDCASIVVPSGNLADRSSAWRRAPGGRLVPRRLASLPIRRTRPVRTWLLLGLIGTRLVKAREGVNAPARRSAAEWRPQYPQTVAQAIHLAPTRPLAEAGSRRLAVRQAPRGATQRPCKFAQTKRAGGRQLLAGERRVASTQATIRGLFARTRAEKPITKGLAARPEGIYRDLSGMTDCLSHSCHSHIFRRK